MRIGIDLGGTKIEAIVLADDGNELARKRIASPVGDYQATVDAIAALVAEIAPSAPSDIPVGIGIPGAISPATGLVKNANSTWLVGHPFADDLSRALARPVRVANDANCFAMSEATDGAGRDAHVVFGVILGTGVGGGIVVGGQLLSGRNAIAGEWGHAPLPWMSEDEWPGRRCNCGRIGCIETFVSGPALAHDFQQTSGQAATAAEIVAMADAGDGEAEAALARYQDRLARALAGAVNILDPDAVVLGGGMSNARRVYANLAEKVGAYAFSDSLDTPILSPVHGDSSGVRGAAWLWPLAQSQGLRS